MVDLQVVADNDQAKIEQNMKEERFRWAAINLTANLMRIAGGHGKPWEACNQAENFAATYRNLMFGHSALTPNELMRVELRRWVQDWWSEDTKEESRERWIKDGTIEVETAQEDVITHSLQIVASRLVGQRTQEQNADSKWFRAFERYLRAWTARRNMRA